MIHSFQSGVNEAMYVMGRGCYHILKVTGGRGPTVGRFVEAINGGM